ncbi:hypothetical protein [Cohnella sp. JJ-181]|uniref:hypothetical protein n=1 Tax=Cohnella rhizoplanae TaxID=2974897 RepID=UPI0022FF5CD2|nr:hypothetical protein [Cohnella sp. JJ-181]CAI6038462.1 hypothetical protein COHCIP112018_00986 [Cohnella sp. JJ-181]
MGKYAIGWIMGVLLVMQGCGERTTFEAPGRIGAPTVAPAASASAAQLPSPSAEIFKEPDEVPRLEVKAGGETLAAQKGSYCWSEPAKGFGVCADAAMPPRIEDVKIVPQVSAGDEIALAWSGDSPDQVHVIVSFPGQERPDEALELQDGKLRAAAGDGDQLYVVTATWPQGTISFYFGLHAEGTV